MSKKFLGIAVGALIGMTALAGAANAALATFDFTDGNSWTNGSAGNVRGFNSSLSGLSLNASAYSTQNTGDSGSFIKAYLGWYDHGLGVTNADNDGSHTVDNDGYTDFVVFQFSEAIDISTIKLYSFGDADINVWLGNAAMGNNFTGTETFANDLGGLSDLGSFTCSNSCDSGESQTYSIASSLYGNTLVVAARLGDDGDEFKIKGLEVSTNSTTTSVPEPATLALFGAGLFGLGAFRRRKTA